MSGLTSSHNLCFSAKNLKNNVQPCKLQFYYMSGVMRKPVFALLCKNKSSNQLRSYRAADQRLCFRYIDSTIQLHVLTRSEISSI